MAHRLLVVVGEEVYSLRICFASFLRGQLYKMYGTTPYAKITKIYDVGSGREYVSMNFGKDFTHRPISNNDDIDGMLSKAIEIDGMTLLSLLRLS